MGRFLRLMSSLSVLLFIVGTVESRNIKHLFLIADALQSNDVPEKLDGSVKFFFGKEKSPKVDKTIRNEIITRKETLRGNSDVRACNLAFMSVLIAFEKRAKEVGANAVVNIASKYAKSPEMSSPTHFECHEGSGYMAVALRGDFATLSEL
jgi:hypothetical protein